MNDFARQSQERIKYLINSYCGGSQQIFADRVGINKASVSQYVNGRNAPTNLTAKKIASAFGVNPAWIMGFDVPQVVGRVEQIAAKLERLTPGQLQAIENLIDSFLS